MEVVVKLLGVCIFVQKVCLVVDQICGKKVGEVFNFLVFSSKKVVEIMKKVLELVVVNVEYNEGVDVDDLKVFIVFVNEGCLFKCIMLCVKGCVDCIVKWFCYIMVKVVDK